MGMKAEVSLYSNLKKLDRLLSNAEVTPKIAEIKQQLAQVINNAPYQDKVLKLVAQAIQEDLKYLIY